MSLDNMIALTLRNFATNIVASICNKYELDSEEVMRLLENEKYIMQIDKCGVIQQKMIDNADKLQKAEMKKAEAAQKKAEKAEMKKAEAAQKKAELALKKNKNSKAKKNKKADEESGEDFDDVEEPVDTVPANHKENANKPEQNDDEEYAEPLVEENPKDNLSDEEDESSDELEVEEYEYNGEPYFKTSNDNLLNVNTQALVGKLIDDKICKYKQVTVEKQKYYALTDYISKTAEYDVFTISTDPVFVKTIAPKKTK